MKTCLICKKDGQRRPRWLNMNIYRRYRRDSLYNILYKFDANTYQMCCDSIAIRKMNGLLFGDLVLNSENQNKYGFHMECYRKLVSIKRKHLREWQTATYMCISYVYIEEKSFESQHDEHDHKTIQSQPINATKIKKEKKDSKKKHNPKANKLNKSVADAQICTISESVNVLQSDVYDIVPTITPITASKEHQTTDSVNATTVPLTTRANRNETDINPKSATHALTNSSQAPQQKRKGLCGASRIRFKCLLECNVPLEEAKVLARRHWADLIKLGYIPCSKPKILHQGESESDQVERVPSLRKPTKASFKKVFHIGIRNFRPMLQEEIKKIHYAIKNEIDMEHRGTAPNIIKFIYKPGWMVAICADNFSKQWLVKKVLEIKPWPEAKLSVIQDSQMPKATTAYVFVTNKEVRHVTEILKQIKRQNKGLNTEYWKVANDKEVKTGRLITLSIDALSVDTLRKTNCEVKLGFRTICFNVKGN